jgi:PAS domain S-box-containing protein
MVKRKKNVTSGTGDRIERRSGYFFFLVLIFLTIGITAISSFSYWQYRKNYRAEVDRNLSAVADAKVDELRHWRSERLEDASIFSKNPIFTNLVQDFFENPKNTNTRRLIQAWMGKIQENPQYNQVCLLNTQGVILLSVPIGSSPISSVVLHRLPEVLRSGQVTFQDFYRSEHDQRVYLSILIPIFDENNHNRSRAILVLNINPDIYLYPFIQYWPTSSRTAETLLMRRDGNSVLFLNKLKFQNNAALNLRIPMGEKELPSVKAVLGQGGIVKAIGYRRVPMVAVLRAVPGSPWFLVVHMDDSEVYAPVQKYLKALAVFAVILLLGAIIGLFLFRRYQRLRFYRNQCQAEEARWGSEMRYRTFIEATSDMVFLKDESFRYLISNAANSAFLGQPEAAVLGRTDFDFMADEIAEHCQASDRKALERGSVVVGEEAVGPKIYRTVKFPVPLPGGCIGVGGYISDITEYKKMDNMLWKQQEEQQTIFDSVPALIFYKDTENRFIRVNRNFAEAMKMSKEELEGKSLFDIYPRKQAEVFWEDDKEVIASGKPKRNILEPMEIKKGVLWVQTDKIPYRDEQGNVIGIIGFSTDVTERRQAEEKRKNILEQLFRAEKLAALGELTAGVAHEINNPLTEILGFSELLLKENKENVGEEIKKDLERIYQAGERIKKIVVKLLRFARREAPERKSVAVNEIIDVVLDIRNYEMKTRNIKLEKNYQPDLPPVTADPSQLEQVFLNLISNAEYAIHETGKAGTLTVTTFLKQNDTEHKKVIIEISDTGGGIPENIFLKLFNPFFTTKPIGKGTGLGLSVSYGIIKEHGGEIFARNREEGGAVFTVELLAEEEGKR